MRVAEWAVVLLISGMMVACGSKKAGTTDAAGSSPKAAPSGNATAAEVAKDARGDVDCPASVKTPARAATAPVDDVLGVRPGLTYDEAANLVLCTNELIVIQPDSSRGFRMETYGQTLRQGFGARFAEPRVEKTSKQIMQEMQDDAIARSGNAVQEDMKPGQSKWYVGTMGLPGQDRVVNAAREEWFEEGKNPTMASVEQALVKKYGTPTRTQKPGAQIYVTWAYDPSSRPITETSPLYNTCTGSADPDGGVNLSPDCGIVIAAIVYSTRENPDLAQSMQVGVVDQAGGYDAVTKTEQALQQADAQHKAKQVEDASKNANAPQL